MYRYMNLEVTRSYGSGWQFHPELEVLFVIEGDVCVKMNDAEYFLQREDVIAINCGVPHEVTHEQDAILCIAKYDYELLVDVLENREGIFLCSSASDGRGDYRKVREDFHELIYQYIRRQNKTVCLQNSLMFRLLDHLIGEFLVSDTITAAKENEDDRRLRNIYQYVSENYRSGISLTQLAESLFVSASTLSRFFKKQTGMYFVDYVNQMKCRYAARNLLYTKMNITKLAVDCGFSNPSALNKVFREVYGMTPTEYRNLKRGTDERKEMDAKLRLELKQKEKDLNPSFQKPYSSHISVDVTQTEPYEKCWGRAINMGSVYSLTLANVQAHALYLTEHLGFTHLRLWSVFSQKLMITDGVQIGNYNYDILDSVLDFLTEHHIRPFLDFGIRPDSVLKAENQPVFYGTESVEFQSKRAWEAMFEDFIGHVVRRYGKEEVENWIFEISFYEIHKTSGHYYQGEDYDSMEVFAHAFHTVKRVCPNAKVGGPGAIANWNRDYFRDFGEQMQHRGIRPDFVSFLLYPYTTRMEDGQVTHDRSPERMYEPEMVKEMRRLMKQSGLDKSLLFITEWNHTLSSRDYLNDSCFRGAYIVKKITEMWKQADLLCLRSGSDWISNYYDTKSIANGADGLLTKDSIRKPAYFALRFLNELGDELIAKGDHYIITKERQNYYILCFNFKWYGLPFFVNEERGYSPEAPESFFEDKAAFDLEIILQSMPENVPYVIKSRTVNGQNGSLLDEWKKFQYDKRLTKQDIKYIRENCFARMMMERQIVKQGKLSVRRTLMPHEITFIQIYEDEL